MLSKPEEIIPPQGTRVGVNISALNKDFEPHQGVPEGDENIVFNWFAICFYPHEAPMKTHTHTTHLAAEWSYFSTSYS